MQDAFIWSWMRLSSISGRTSRNAIVRVEPHMVEKIRNCILNHRCARGLHTSWHDLQIEILLIRIRGIISIHSHEDPGGDIEALLLSSRASKDASKDASRVLPDRAKLDQPAGTRSSPHFLVSPWMFAPAHQRHLVPRRIRSNARRFPFRSSPKSSIQHPFSDLSALPDVMRCRRSGS